jgi:hypothetical protein
MWILHFLPDSVLLYVVHCILIVGAVGTFLSFFVINRILRFFPAIAPYYTLAQILSLILLAAGLYFSGGYHTEMEWRAKVAEAELKIKEAEAKSQIVNTVVQTKVVEKVKVVKDIQIEVQEKIKEVEKRIDAECKLDPEIPKILNQAAGASK